VFERCLIHYSPTNRLSDDPVESETKLWHRNTYPTPPSSSNTAHVYHSVNPHQTNSCKYCWCKYLVQSLESCFLCLKQTNMRLIFSHTFFSHSLSLSRVVLSWWRERYSVRYYITLCYSLWYCFYYLNLYYLILSLSKFLVKFLLKRIWFY